MNQHIRRHHKDHKEQNEQKTEKTPKCECEVCLEPFHNNGNLRRHKERAKEDPKMCRPIRSKREQVKAVHVILIYKD